MAVDHGGPQARTTRRLLLGTLLAVAGVLALASPAVARPHPERRLALPGASFPIPAGSSGTVWTLNLWQKGQRLASTTGTSGVLRVIAPPSVHGMVQADVRRSTRWYSGRRFPLNPKGGGNGGGGGTGPGTGNNSGGGPPTTDPPPPTGSSGGSAPATLTATTDPPGPVSALAFTGVGSPLRTLALAGVSSILLGAYLVARRRPTTPPTLHDLLRRGP